MTDVDQKTRRFAIPLAFFCVYFFWGSTFVAIRYGVQFLSPAFVSGFRYCTAGLLLMGILALRGVPWRISGAELKRALLLALLMLTMNNVMVSWGEQYISAGLAALLAAGIPLLIALAETAIPGGTRLNRMGWLGTALGFVGLSMLLLPVLQHGLSARAGAQAGAANDRSVLIGTGILLVANLGWVAGSVYSGRRPTTLPPLLASAWQMLLGGGINILLGTALGGWHSAHWTRGALGAVLWLAVFGSLVGYTAYTYLLHTVPVAKVATYAYVNPIVAVGLSAVFLHEGLHGSQWIAMGVILLAVALVTASRVKRTDAGQVRREAGSSAEVPPALEPVDG